MIISSGWVVGITSENVEMYIKTIWELNQKRGQAKTTEISSILKVVPSSVTEMLQKLQEEGYIVHVNYKGCKLTEKGNSTALKLIRKERLLKKFLHDILRIPKNKVRDQACKLEHYISSETEKSLCKFLGCPANCPVDNKHIPKCSECLSKFT